MRRMESRALLELLEEGEGALEPQLAYVAVQAVELDEGELAAAVRRALLVLASGGDPHRDLDPEGRAVSVLGDALGSRERREALSRNLRGLRGQSEGLARVSAALEALLSDEGLAWRWAACVLLADELGD